MGKESERLKQRPHFRGVGQPAMCGNVSVERFSLQLGRQCLRPRRNAKPFEKDALRGELTVCTGQITGQGLKVHMRGQVCCAGRGQWIGGRMIAHCLKGVASAAPGAVVDNQRGAAMIRDPLADQLRDGAGGLAQLDHVTGGRILKSMFKGGEGGGRGQAKGQRAVVQSDDTFAPASRIAPELPDRQRIEKLVRHKKERRVLGKGAHCIVPDGGIASQRVGLTDTQRDRYFDEMQLKRLMESGHRTCRAQDVGHQRAAAGAEFG
ncbi:hypothetical protein IMCC21224_112908 [Puniceibacterium sp. IMCC21224]|nr:hypothetical protein IMCC21224_112908 [Puniceibacterium sp. IMCC21224]